MSTDRKTSNPWYGLIVIVGVLFVITSFSYMMLMMRSADRGSDVPSPAPQHPLFTFMEKYGTTALIVEVGVLGAATVGAIWVDDLRRRKRKRQGKLVPESPETEP